MRTAFMSFSCPQLDLDEMLALAKRLGYDGIEPRIEAGHAHGIEMDVSAQARRELKEKADGSDIALCCVATSRRYADPETAQQHVDDTLRCIDLAADLGSPRLRVFGGASWVKVCPERRRSTWSPSRCAPWPIMPRREG
jgi:sugar phosphate isomerase/epimerase